MMVCKGWSMVDRWWWLMPLWLVKNYEQWLAEDSFYLFNTLSTMVKSGRSWKSSCFSVVRLEPYSHSRIATSLSRSWFIKLADPDLAMVKLMDHDSLGRDQWAAGLPAAEMILVVLLRVLGSWWISIDGSTLTEPIEAVEALERASWATAAWHDKSHWMIEGNHSTIEGNHSTCTSSDWRLGCTREVSK